MVMRNSLRRWEAAGFVFVCVVGTLLQYVFRWTGGNTLVASFSAVNESAWEHLKMLFVPYFLFSMLEYPHFSEAFRNYFAAKAAAGLVGVLAIPTLFYTLGGMFGALPAWVNVAIFYISAALMYLLSYRLLRINALRGGVLQPLGFLLLWGMMALFVLFTYRTPALPLFRDPVGGGYGLSI